MAGRSEACLEMTIESKSPSHLRVIERSVCAGQVFSISCHSRHVEGTAGGYQHELIWTRYAETSSLCIAFAAF